MDEFVTWENLTTHAGSMLATTTLTQFLKELGPLKKIPTRMLSYVLALILLLLATAFTSGLTPSAALLSLVNAAMVSLASNGAYDAICTSKSRRTHRADGEH